MIPNVSTSMSVEAHNTFKYPYFGAKMSIFLPCQKYSDLVQVMVYTGDRYDFVVEEKLHTSLERS